MSDPPPQLDYAQPSPWHRRRSSRRVVVVCFLLIAFGTAIRWARTVADQVEANFAFQRCMKHLPTAGQLSYDASATVANVPPEWSTFCLKWSGLSPVTTGTVFLHERKTPAGASRLVAVDLLTCSSRALQLQAHVFAPPVGVAPAQRKSAIIHLISLPEEDGVFKILEGTPDPQDSTHFTFALRSKSRMLEVDGWLREDTVLLEPREPSEVTPAR